MLIVFIYVVLSLSLGSIACKWPTSDVLFIIDGTLNLNVYQQLNEVNFIRQAFRSMSISPTNVHVAVAQYTPKGRVEFTLESSQNNEEAESRLQGVSYTPCDPFSKSVPCTPAATLNSLTRQALLPGNRRTVPDVLILLGSSKYNLPYVGPTEVLFSPISPIHTFQISIGGPSPEANSFEPAATLIRMHALDFDSLQNLVVPLCESVASFIGDQKVGTAGFGSFCWVVIGLLILLIVLLFCACAYLIYYFRRTESQYKKKIAESELALRKQNEYFTAKIHAQMEDQIATNKQHVEEFKKQQETLQVHQLELNRQLQNTVSPSVPGNNSNRQLFVPVYPNKDGYTNESIPVIQQPRSNSQNNNEGNTVHLTFDGREIEVSNGKLSTRILGDGDGKQTTVQFQNNGALRGNKFGEGGGTNREGEGPNDTGFDGHIRQAEGLRIVRASDIAKADEEGRNRDGKGREDGRGRRGVLIGGKKEGEGRSETERTRGRRETSEELNHEGIPVSDSELYKSGRHQAEATSRTEPTTSRRPKHPLSRLNLEDTNEGETARHPNWNSQDSEYTETTDDSVDSNPTPLIGTLPPNHPARTLPPIDILFLVDSSSSIGITNFDAMKENINKLLDDIDIAPGRSRAALIQYAQEPGVVFGFDKYYSISNVKKGVNRMSYTGGPTMLAKALSFAAGVLYNEQNMKEARKKHKIMPTPRHDRLQVMCVCSDGGSDDNIERASNYIHEKLQIKVLGMVSKSFNKEKLLPVTRFDGSVFVMTQTESMSIWIWRHQKLWAENYSFFLERNKDKQGQKAK